MKERLDGVRPYRSPYIGIRIFYWIMVSRWNGELKMFLDGVEISNDELGRLIEPYVRLETM